MNITLAQFRQMIPTNRDATSWHSIATEFFSKYNINTTNRIAGFMAQTAHESMDFTVLEENLNYSAERLLQVFPRYFGRGKANAAEYARNPEKLANYVYMDVNRSKSGALGNTLPGDGWRFRGGGIKQLTGRNNFSAFGRDIGMTAEEAADYVRTRRGAFESACWFWKTNNLERYADRDDIDGMSRRVNGGRIGLEDRRTRYARAKAILSSTPRPAQSVAPVPPHIPASAVPATPVTPVSTTPVLSPQSTTYETIRRGSRGPVVQRMQRALGISADGIFGLQTEIAVRSWQRSNKYPSNGILDNQQLRKLFGEN